MDIKPKYSYGILLGFIIIITTAGYWLFLRFIQPDLQKRAIWGDSFGGLNALFSGLAFAGLLYALYLQINELKLQRFEISENRKELNRQRTAIENQNENIVAQRNLQTFFELLNLQNLKRNNTQLYIDEKEMTGIATFKKIEDELNLYLDHTTANNTELIKESIRNSFNTTYEKFEDILLPYFKNIYFIFKFTELLTLHSQSFFQDIILNQMSKAEQKLFFFYIISNHNSFLKDYKYSMEIASKITSTIHIRKLHLDYFKTL